MNSKLCKRCEQFAQDEHRSRCALQCDARTKCCWLFERNDIGSGTVTGAALIICAAVLVSVVMGIGNIVICHSQARSAANLSALTGAQSVRTAAADPCSAAAQTATANNSQLVDCTVDGDDVQLTVSVATRVPLISQVHASARAGPVACDE